MLVLPEGSEQTRNKRSVRRLLNKKYKPVEEAVMSIDEQHFIPGSMHHMQNAVHDRHVNGHESHDYHIHLIGRYEPKEEPLAVHHHYILIHKKGISNGQGGGHYPVHTFSVKSTNGGGHEVQHLRQV